MHHHLHQKVSDSVGHQLDAPGDNPVDARQDENTVPDPEYGEHLQVGIHNMDEEDGETGYLVIYHV